MTFPFRRVPAASVLATLLLLAGASAHAADAERPQSRFRSTMDRVFGPGRWRETSGYRSAAKEEELRRQGAGAVPPGRRSSHSSGNPAAPGAYDAVVPGMPQSQAAALLRRSANTFPRVLAEGAHGFQGPHLHIEVKPGPPGRSARAGPCGGYHGQTIYMRFVNGRQNPLVACEIRWREQHRADAAEAGEGG